MFISSFSLTRQIKGSCFYSGSKQQMGTSVFELIKARREYCRAWAIS